MDFKVQSVRFSKDYFSDYESCAKWLEQNGIAVTEQQEVEKYWIFEQSSEEKFNETSLQEFKLGSGIMAVVGLAQDSPTTFENVGDQDPVTPNDVSTPAANEAADQLKQVLTAQTAAFNGFVQQIQDAIAPIKAQLTASTAAVTKSQEPTVEIFVPIVKVADKRQVFGEVLVPNEVDGQDHIYSEDEVEKAAHYWMKEFQQLGEMHEKKLSDGQIKVLETYIAPTSFKLETSDGEEKEVRKGTWLLKVFVEDDEVWEKVKKGELNGFSIGGVATVTELE